MSATKSYNSFDYQPADMVPVIASFDTEGHITPLYVRIHGTAYKIDHFWVSSHFLDIYEFRCTLIDNDRMRPLTLTFYGKEKVWLIPPNR